MDVDIDADVDVDLDVAVDVDIDIDRVQVPNTVLDASDPKSCCRNWYFWI